MVVGDENRHIGAGLEPRSRRSPVVGFRGRQGPPQAAAPVPALLPAVRWYVLEWPGAGYPHQVLGSNNANNMVNATMEALKNEDSEEVARLRKIGGRFVGLRGGMNVAKLKITLVRSLIGRPEDQGHRARPGADQDQ